MSTLSKYNIGDTDIIGVALFRVRQLRVAVLVIITITLTDFQNSFAGTLDSKFAINLQ